MWITLGKTLAAIAIAAAPLFNRSPADAETVGAGIRDAAAHIGGLMAAAYVVAAYVRGRSAVKIAAREATVVSKLAKQPLQIMDSGA